MLVFVALLISFGSSFPHAAEAGLLARREGTVACWASYDEGRGRKRCYSREEWVGALRASSLPEFPPSRWKIYSPPVLRSETKNVFYRGLGGLPSSCRTFACRFRARIEWFREKVSLRLSQCDRGGVLRKLILNEDSDRTAHDLLRSLGFVHHLTSAGIHLYALSRTVESVVLFSSKWLGISVVRAGKLAAVTSWFLWAIAWILNGLRPGMLRPVLIVAARSSSARFGFRWHWAAPLGLSLAVDLFLAAGAWFQGQSPWAPGRIHYALAVGGGLLAMQAQKDRQGSVWLEHLALSLGAWWFTAVWDAFHQGWFSIAVPLISLLTLPILSGIVFPGVVISVLIDAPWVGPIAAASDWVIRVTAEVCLSVPVIWVTDSFTVIAAVFFGLIYAAASRYRSSKSMPAWGIGLLSVGLMTVSYRTDRVRTIEQLDIGQGDAALLSFEGGEAGLIDTGSERILSPSKWIALLGMRGINQLRFVALTHLDEDHSGGLKRLTRLVPVEFVITSRAELETERGREFARDLKTQGVRVRDWKSAGFPFSVHEPAVRKNLRSGGNSLMSALIVPVGEDWVYLSAGDADEGFEKGLLPWFEAQLSIEKFRSRKRVLKISHHGSRFSTSDLWLTKLKPERAWISSGVGNMFGHPTGEVLKRLKRFEAQVERTDVSGVLRVEDVRRRQPEHRR